jgi:hypothetical protein
MSLVAAAIRATTVLSLWKATYAEDRIYDSVIAPLDEMTRDIPRPIITVAIDEIETDAVVLPRDFAAYGDRRLSLVIEIALARSISVDGGASAVVIPETDSGLENAIDLLSHQVMRRLMSDDGFGDHFRGLCLRFRSVRQLRGVSTDAAARIAARQIVIEIDVISEPSEASFADPSGLFPRLCAALRGVNAIVEPELAAYVGLADAIEAAAKYPSGLSDWRQVAARLGLTTFEAVALGITPHVDTGPDQTAPSTASVDIQGDAFDADRATALLGAAS